MLVFAFPVLFVAALSCLYLHLVTKLSDHNDRNTNRKNLKPRLAWRKRPVLVKGPLGVVSLTELLFLTMFMGLLSWSLYSYLTSMFTDISREAGDNHQQVWKSKLEMSGLAVGLVGNICLAFLFYPVTRSSSVLQLFGLTSESSIRYHIWAAHLALTFFTAHGLCYILFWASSDQISLILKWSKIGFSNLAGGVALLSGLAMWVTSIPSIRRKIFELFFYTHHLYILFVVFYVFHVGFSSTCLILPGFYLFLIDRYLRFLQSQQRVRLLSARILPGETVELNFLKSQELNYNPTSIMFVNVPGISKLQWHPFSITSSCEMDHQKLSIVIKSEGRWSSELYKKLSSSSSISMDRLEVSIEGPYGPVSTHFHRRDMLIMISGGSGITPFISIIRDLLFRANESLDTPRVLLISVFRKSLDVTMLDLLLPVSGTSIDIHSLKLQVQAYVTKEQGPSPDQNLIQTKWFKLDPLDAPVSAILGPSSWLWLGAIITSSFIIFLIVIGIVTRYHIYPIDHNSDMIYPSAPRAAVNMIFTCISIAIAATAAFVWNKKNKDSKEMRQIQNRDSPAEARTMSDSSWIYSDERELESLPHHSFLQFTEVHYGERPDLKKILSENCKGTSVGVLVSGPKKMKQEVAAICSSGFAENLHFKSMSFNW
ncbi:ferric reduction oxidase 2-like isoform X2 [Carica papaya]|nr:ferric reduction oxidase 2-like isoform X2 [Carica papaya]